MLKAEGVSMLILPGAPVRETKTFTCSHCQSIRVARDETQYWCDTCDAMVCARPECTRECVPFKQKMDEAERRDYLRRIAGA